MLARTMSLKLYYRSPRKSRIFFCTGKAPINSVEISAQTSIRWLDKAGKAKDAAATVAEVSVWRNCVLVSGLCLPGVRMLDLNRAHQGG